MFDMCVYKYSKLHFQVRLRLLFPVTTSHDHHFIVYCLFQGSLRDVPAYVYLENQFRRFQVTGEKECRGENEANHMANTYLCLLHSNRRYEVEKHSLGNN